MITITTLLTAGPRVRPFTKPSKRHTIEGCPGWNEYVASDFYNALHWHRIYPDHGCYISDFQFWDPELTRSTYYKKVRFIN